MIRDGNILEAVHRALQKIRKEVDVLQLPPEEAEKRVQEVYAAWLGPESAESRLMRESQARVNTSPFPRKERKIM